LTLAARLLAPIASLTLPSLTLVRQMMELAPFPHSRQLCGATPPEPRSYLTGPKPALGLCMPVRLLEACFRVGHPE